MTVRTPNLAAEFGPNILGADAADLPAIRGDIRLRSNLINHNGRKGA